MCAGVRTTRSPHPDDGQRVLDEEVEDERDDADEGEDRHPDVLPRLRRVQLVLGHVPYNKLQVTKTIQRAVTKFLLDVVPELPQRRPELHHVLRDGVEVLESAVDVAGTFLHVQSVVQDNLVTKRLLMLNSTQKILKFSIIQWRF